MPKNILTDRVQQELEKASEKYHILGAWIAIIFDPIFAVTDYINIPNDWKNLLFVRLSVSAITLTTLLLRKKLKINTNKIIVFIPFLLISLQNAYTFSLISSDNVMGHCLNYIALLIGAGMFILWNWRYSLISILLSGIATDIFITLNPNIQFNNFILNGGLLLIVVALFMIILIQTRYGLTIKEIEARLKVEELNKEVLVQKDIVEERNSQITSSIEYAQRIQKAILGKESLLKDFFNESFILFEPKDILSGDFYWFYENKAENIKIVIAADCTGHGVPGALTTVLGSSILNDIIIQKKTYSPDLILKALDKAVISSFSSKSGGDLNVQDGMDISILTFQEDEILFSAAKNPLYYIQNEKIHQIKGSKFAIGSNQYKTEKVFDLHKLNLSKGTKMYIFTDGFQDQLGEKQDRKYMTKNYREFLHETSTKNMSIQKDLLQEEFIKWKGNKSQTDDVLVIGIEI